MPGWFVCKTMIPAHKRKFSITLILAALCIFLAIGSFVLAQESASGTQSAQNFAMTFLWLAVILIAAKISSLVEKVGQPAVLGELVIGIILGNLALIGISIFEPIKHDGIIAFLSELGVVILLFQIGLESNIVQMKKVGMRAFLVACVGVIVPFVLGTYVVGPWIFPGLSVNAYLFLGAALTATSVGITARVFRDLGKLSLPEAQIVLGAAVIDDVLGLIILAVVSAIVTVGAISIGGIGIIIAKAIIFLLVAIVIGILAAPVLGKLFSQIHTGIGMKFTLAIVFCLVFAYLAQLIGLAAIVGAFAAGLVLEGVHFKYFKDSVVISEITEIVEKHGTQDTHTAEIKASLKKHGERHIHELIEPVGLFFVPVFFVLTGIHVNLAALFNPQVLLVALAITAVAVVGKIVSGLAAGKVNKLIVGVGMIPRGEVGLIFATMGKTMGVLSDQLFSVIVIMVILTTLLTPPILSILLKRQPQ